MVLTWLPQHLKSSVRELNRENVQELFNDLYDDLPKPLPEFDGPVLRQLLPARCDAPFNIGDWIGGSVWCKCVISRGASHYTLVITCALSAGFSVSRDASAAGRIEVPEAFLYPTTHFLGN